MDRPQEEFWADLVPELLVDDVNASLAFWCEALGFRVRYHRLELGFAYIERGGNQVMLDERDGTWETAAMDRPYGRGVNFQMRVADIQPILDALAARDWPLYQAPREAWYRDGDIEHGQREFLVQDPDGYLLRFAQHIGERPARR